MKKKFAVFDIDGTIFRSHLYMEVVLALAREEKLHPALNKKTLELYDSWKRRTHENAFEDFDKLTVIAIDEILTELDPAIYDEAIQRILPPLLDHTYVYTKNLIEELKKQGYFILAISGARIEEATMFAKHHGFDDWIGQTYHRTKDGKNYTGKMSKTYKDKDIILKKFITKHNLDLKDSYAVGDTGGDIEMLEMVKRPIVFNPNHELLEYAKKSGWKIVIERKSIAYTLNQEGSDGQYILA